MIGFDRPVRTGSRNAHPFGTLGVDLAVWLSASYATPGEHLLVIVSERAFDSCFAALCPVRKHSGHVRQALDKTLKLPNRVSLDSHASFNSE